MPTSFLVGGQMPKSLHTARHRTLVDCLVEYRRGLGITQTELAKRLGRPQSIVAAMEGGGRRIDLVELLEFADVLDFDVQELVERVRRIPR